MNDTLITIKEFYALPENKKCAPEVLEILTTEDIETLLSKYVLSPTVKNKMILEMKKRKPNFGIEEFPESGGSENEESKDDKVYPALGFIAGVYKFMGWLFIIGGFFGAVNAFSSDSNVSVEVGILVIVGSLFFSLLSFASAEFIKVFTDISSYAYRILKHLKQNKYTNSLL